MSSIDRIVVFTADAERPEMFGTTGVLGVDAAGVAAWTCGAAGAWVGVAAAAGVAGAGVPKKVIISLTICAGGTSLFSVLQI